MPHGQSAFVRRYPDVSVAIFCQGRCPIAGKFPALQIGLSVQFKRIAIILGNTVGSGDPDVSECILKQGIHGWLRQSFFKGKVFEMKAFVGNNRLAKYMGITPNDNK